MADQESGRDGTSDRSARMEHEPQISGAERYTFLAEQMRDEDFRHAYASGLTREFIARQFRAFRGAMSQTEFGKLIGQKQSRVSQLEDPNYGRETFQTCFDIGERLDVVFFARFVDFQTFLRLTMDLSDAAAHPEPYNQAAIDRLAREIELKEPFREKPPPQTTTEESPDSGKVGGAKKSETAKRDMAAIPA